MKADRDGDGLLNKADIILFLKRHNVEVSDQEVQDAIVFADGNRDGKITVDEFMAAFWSGFATK